MVKYSYELVVADKCSHCKMKEGICEGQGIIQGAVLVSCPCFIDKRGKYIVTGNEKIPYPKKKKAGAK